MMSTDQEMLKIGDIDQTNMHHENINEKCENVNINVVDSVNNVETSQNIACEIEMASTEVIEEVIVSEEQVIVDTSQEDAELCVNSSLNVSSEKLTNTNFNINFDDDHLKNKEINEQKLCQMSNKLVINSNTESTEHTANKIESFNDNICVNNIEQKNVFIDELSSSNSVSQSTSNETISDIANAPMTPPYNSNISSNKKKFGKFRILLDQNGQRDLELQSQHQHQTQNQQQSSIQSLISSHQNEKVTTFNNNELVNSSEDSCSIDSKSEKCDLFVPPTLVPKKIENEQSIQDDKKANEVIDDSRSTKTNKAKSPLRKKLNCKKNQKGRKSVVVNEDDQSNDSKLDESDSGKRRRSNRIKSLEEKKEMERVKNDTIFSRSNENLDDEKDFEKEKDDKDDKNGKTNKKSNDNEKTKDKDKNKKKKTRKKKHNNLNDDDSSEDSLKKINKNNCINSDNLDINSGNSNNSKISYSMDCFTPPLPPSSTSSINNFKSGLSGVNFTSKSQTSDSDDSPKPEKVKSRWRRNSELESGHSSESSFINSNRALESLNNSLNIINQQRSSYIPPLILKETEPPPQFDQIEENIYLFERRKSKSKKEVRRMLCDCVLTKEDRNRGLLGCGDDCLNKMLMIECGSRCPLGDSCANKRFQKRMYSKVDPFKTEKKGWGLRAIQSIPQGAFIMEYIGEVLSPNEFKNRVNKYSKENRQHYYFMALRSDEIIDATSKGNITRFINHSCDPNSETQKWTVNGELRIGFFAKCNIERGQEITFDYQFQRYGKEAQKCYCESINCRGYIGGSNVSIDIDESNISSKSKKDDESIIKKKDEDEFEDLALEDEIDKLTNTGGLKNRQQTLLLARLMVRADDSINRIKLLDVIKLTQEVAYLRLLLDYHCLQLLWSWMVDLEDLHLKASILEVLEIFPIPNKTMLKDSKILEIVERWSKPVETTSIQNQNNVKMNVEIVKYSLVNNEANSDLNDSKSEAVITADEIPEKNIEKDTVNNDIDSSKSVNNNVEDKSLTEKTDELSNDKIANDLTNNVTNNDDNKNEQVNKVKQEEVGIEEKIDICDTNDIKDQNSNIMPNATYKDQSRENGASIQLPMETKASLRKGIVNEKKIIEEKLLPDIPRLAEKLLHLWKDLKEVFRIPRLERDKRHQDEIEADRRTEELEERRAKGLPIFYEKGKRGDNRDNTIAGILRRKQKRSAQDDKKPLQSNININNNNVSSTIIQSNFVNNTEIMSQPTPPKINKDAHRFQFEVELMRKQYEEAVKVYQKQLEQYKSFVHHQHLQVNSTQSIPPLGFNSNFQNFDPAILPPPLPPQPSAPHLIQQPYTYNENPNGLQTPTLITNIQDPYFTPSPSPLPIPPPTTPTQTKQICHKIPEVYNTTIIEESLPCSEEQYTEIQSFNKSVKYFKPSTLLQNDSVLIECTDESHELRPDEECVIHTDYGVELVSDNNNRLNLHKRKFFDTIYPCPGTYYKHDEISCFVSAPFLNNDGYKDTLIFKDITIPHSLSHTKNRISTALPEHWKSYKDTNGDIFYHNKLKKISQWNLPEEQIIYNFSDIKSTVNESVIISSADSTSTPKDELLNEINQDSSDLSNLDCTSTSLSLLKPVLDFDPDPRKRKHLMNNLYNLPVISDISDSNNDFSIVMSSGSIRNSQTPTETKGERKMKEKFKTEMSEYIKHCLNPYYRSGKIIGNDNFKYLCRKLTHSVMLKEIKHCKSIDDLNCNETVKHKAKDYVRKYMAKQDTNDKKDLYESKEDKVSPKVTPTFDSVIENGVDFL